MYVHEILFCWAKYEKETNDWILGMIGVLLQIQKYIIISDSPICNNQSK